MFRCMMVSSGGDLFIARFMQKVSVRGFDR
ncbi:hypothetical protein [Klebsiella phage 05F01]|nr:hypothetical protein [Klebsiella phage 05F01]